MIGQDSLQAVRIDKWLWAARFFKTRALAAEAVAGGKIEINGGRPKPSRMVRAGDRLTIRRGPYQWTITVRGVSQLRGRALQAQALYDEHEESVRLREAAAAQMRLERGLQFDLPGRPSKKDRRAMIHFTKRRW
jgi:ribosome-associated heat shock protein Hsp15